MTKTLTRTVGGWLAGLAIATTFTLAPTTATAGDFRVSNGYGGEYAYEVWRSRDNTWYQLRVWRRQDYPRGAGFIVDRTFLSSREALTHFDCDYARRAIPQCPRR
ncbi:MAG: hypothetical protein KME20_00170 [Kaiparowitsia implicata GSE-PSE-MK54-09C]|jgi:hypothetical protein|nr:hypothetical protein [Kaiparowitsia implicata GSE-PSE-MK54-09C]